MRVEYEMTDWNPGIDMTGVSISEMDRKDGSPKAGDKIACNPANHEDRFLVAAGYQLWTSDWDEVKGKVGHTNNRLWMQVRRSDYSESYCLVIGTETALTEYYSTLAELETWARQMLYDIEWNREIEAKTKEHVA